MPQNVTIRISPAEAANETILIQRLAAAAKTRPQNINAYQIIRRSLDARSRNIVAQLQVNVFINEEFYDAFEFHPNLQNVANAPEVYIAGAGPAGLFAALELIEQGLKPIIIERGKDVRARRRDLAAMNKEGKVNPESNYCYGEGGAGTYSDGKLYTRSTKRGNILKSLQWFVHFGATERILQEAHPHIGTNKLPGIIANMREAIIECGGEVLFDTKLTDIFIENNQVKGIELNNDTRIKTSSLILATGHSARDIFRMLAAKKVLIEAKPFALGVRIEHQQSLIDAAQYHCPIGTERNQYLPPASYSLVSQEAGRGVFSFCMCPGGIIAPASTDEGELVVNGWSPSKRDGQFANSGMVVTVDEKDFTKYGFTGPLAGMKFQQMVEQKAWQVGGGSLKAPAQRMTDFVSGRLSNSLNPGSYLPGFTSGLLSEVLPKEVHDSLRLGFQTFGKKMNGYFTEEANVAATESRTSSPVRIPRNNETLQHVQVSGLFPCAEGAGYAGGIISAAMDGAKVAVAVKKFLNQ
ncbi:NAD(P)/FAD-dependent oxidoreductase [Faecalibacter sp. LW9]|uniref:NAD(P)/FAD-dependent oxidoreductase n=1 Tax=Faecalibacter sp. LW9 TaxID=3103144 RepID=UPI002AFFB74F|nr:FAD-dependent monooxygenase [Faecalibacter sp. LW9]